MKYFIIAGEASGDLHGSNLMKALRNKDPQAYFVGLGGDKMRAEGCDIKVDYRDMAYMGFIAVLANIHKVYHNLHVAQQALKQEKPDALILIDYPSFNLRIAKFCHKHLPNTKIIYYIPPKIWAWKEWRVHQIAKYSNHILGIFPFEPMFYQKHGYTCQYVGNPTSYSIYHWKKDISHCEEKKNIIALLPGSRPSEIKKCLPTMLAAAREVAEKQYDIVITAAPGIDDAFYTPFIKNEKLTRDTYNTLAQAKAAIVNSGTATLETALIGCPQTAVYYVAGSKYLEWILKPIMFKIKHFTLVNIISNKEVIQELIAKRFTEKNVVHELTQLLNNEQYRAHMLNEYKHIQDILGSHSAPDNAAEIITNLLNN